MKTIDIKDYTGKILYKALDKNQIAEKRETKIPSCGMTVYGYTKRSGAPTRYMVRLQDEKKWRRLMCLCFSNVGSLFLNLQGEKVFVREYEQDAL